MCTGARIWHDNASLYKSPYIFHGSLNYHPLFWQDYQGSRISDSTGALYPAGHLPFHPMSWRQRAYCNFVWENGGHWAIRPFIHARRCIRRAVSVALSLTRSMGGTLHTFWPVLRLKRESSTLATTRRNCGLRQRRRSGSSGNTFSASLHMRLGLRLLPLNRSVFFFLAWRDSTSSIYIFSGFLLFHL